MPITALPTPPTRSDPATFAARGDAFLTAIPVFQAEANVLQADVNAKQLLAASSANAAQADRILAAAAASNPAVINAAANAIIARDKAAEAAVSAATAQAVSPDSPIRLNSRFITANLTIGSAYNAASVGPISIRDGVTVTVQDNATWSIN
jgi:hypothetical protein